MQLRHNHSHHPVTGLPRYPQNRSLFQVHLFLRQRMPFQILFILTQQAASAPWANVPERVSMRARAHQEGHSGQVASHHLEPDRGRVRG